MSGIIEYLKGPELVVIVQKWFGVKYNNINNSSSNSKSSINNSDDDEGLPADAARPPTDDNPAAGLHKRNISTGSSDEGFNEPSNDAATNNSNSDQIVVDDANAYEITNWFWYYLFVIGTEFGDEIFYATMIPFWFWNVDGAVGRRVVFVWAVVMYIGMSAERNKTSICNRDKCFV